MQVISIHNITELSPWERLFKRIVWQQLGDISSSSILDFGSGEGITADHFAGSNDVTAIEPYKSMLANAWSDHSYRQIIGDVTTLSAFPDDPITYFPAFFCTELNEPNPGVTYILNDERKNKTTE